MGDLECGVASSGLAAFERARRGRARRGGCVDGLLLASCPGESHIAADLYANACLMPRSIGHPDEDVLSLRRVMGLPCVSISKDASDPTRPRVGVTPAAV